ncbi:hypothetical protein PAEPH01_0171 [Pancytospora epiphaga]|nr:hypothetical protein PAEPH01_0171 [Pancytospora epiphaga]
MLYCLGVVLCTVHFNNEGAHSTFSDYLSKGNSLHQSASSDNGSNGHIDPPPSVLKTKAGADRQIRNELATLSEKVDAMRNEFLKAVKDNASNANTNRVGDASLVHGFVLPCGICSSCLEGSPCPMGLLSALYEDIQAGEDYTILTDKEKNKQNYYLLKQLDDIFNKILQSSSPTDKPAFQLIHNPTLKKFLTDLGIVVMGLSSAMGMGYPMGLGMGMGMPWQGPMMGQPGPYMHPGMYPYPGPFMPGQGATGLQQEEQGPSGVQQRPNPNVSNYPHGFYPPMGGSGMMGQFPFYPGMFMAGQGAGSNPLAMRLMNYYMARLGNFPGLQGGQFGGLPVGTPFAANRQAGPQSGPSSPYDN